MKHPIVINKFRLGDRSERIAALADEWGCSVTVATARLLDAGLAAVDRDEKLTPKAIRAAFEYGKASGILDCSSSHIDSQSLPTGAGKTRLIKAIAAANPGMVVYTRESLAQAVHSYDGPAKLSFDIDRMKREIELTDIRLNLSSSAPDESCPGCGCQPGDGPTEGCTHPDGCGYYEDEDPRSMGWVGCNGLP